MIFQVFAVIDEKAGAFALPFFKPTIGQAVRDFGDACQDSQSAISRHPADYRLYHLGTFDDNSGQFEMLSPIVNLGGGDAFVSKPEAVRKELHRAG